ncbi:MAG: Gfo/Idh/MocA family oxidoreductase [Nanoarchaeota archaeon]|nr:Gfo/Idh/MocA family oxidoreductase [Nanoarchaeota archaeon]
MINVAVIGTGMMGRNHARVYTELEGVHLVGVVDVSKKMREETAKSFSCKAYETLSELLKHERVDAVSVCVPTSFHFDVAMEVIAAGIPLLIEKPITATIEQAKKVVAAANERGVLLMVGHIERFNPGVQKLKALIVSGKLGKITSLISRRVGIFPPRIKDSNVVIDLAVHDIDIFNFLLNSRPICVHGYGGKALQENKEDYAGMLLKYANATGLIEVNWITPVKVRILNVTGTKGYAELNYITQQLVVYKSIYEKAYDEFGDFVVKFGTPKREEVVVRTAEPLKLELAHFIECVRTKKQPLVGGEAGIAALEVALQATTGEG